MQKAKVADPYVGPGGERLRKLDGPERLGALKIEGAMRGLTAAERRRVLVWAYDRFVPPHQRGTADSTTIRDDLAGSESRDPD